jgi:hypothetical protein
MLLKNKFVDDSASQLAMLESQNLSSQLGILLMPGANVIKLFYGRKLHLFIIT